MTSPPPVDLVRRTMAEVLAIPEVAADDDLIALGGDSLGAITLQMRLEEETGIALNVAFDILAEPTPRAIAQRLRDPQTAG
jgi:acyl carrier protein